MRLALFCLLLSTPIFAQHSVAAPGAPFPGFIDMPRSTAMGGAQSAVASSNDALEVNPAGLVQNRSYHFELDGADDVRFPAQGIEASLIDSATSAVATGLLFSRWGSGQPGGRGEGWSLGFSYAGQLGGGVLGGATTKYIRYYSLTGLNTSWAEDVGVLSRHGSFSWALVVKNLSLDTVPLFPRTGTVGIAWGSDTDYRLAADYFVDFSDTNHLKQSGALGGELLWSEAGIALRAGARRDFTASLWWASAGVAFITSSGQLQLAWRRRLTDAVDQVFEAGITIFLE